MMTTLVLQAFFYTFSSHSCNAWCSYSVHCAISQAFSPSPFQSQLGKGGGVKMGSVGERG